MDQEELLMLCGTELFGFQSSTCYTDITLWAFLHNLENISGYASDVSSFHCEYIEDGSGVLLSYYYQWKGLEVITVGFIKAVAKNIYHTSIEMKVLSLRELKSKRNRYLVCYSVKGKAYACIVLQYHYSYLEAGMLDSSKLREQDLDELDHEELTKNDCLLNVNKEEQDVVAPVETSWPITKEVFNELFPFNIVFDNNLVIRAIGNAFTRLCPAMVNCCMADLFKISVPAMSCTYANIVLHKSDKFQLSCKKQCVIDFKGEMIVDAKSGEVVYICSPEVDSLESMNSCNVFVSDFFYLMDCQEAVFLNMHLETAKRVRKSLEAAKRSLGVSQQEKEAEKKRSLDLLHSILPSFAVEKYLKGEEFEPTKYDNVTVLFSDIEDFANICDYYEPLEAVKLLDSLFSEFDYLTEQYGVFKVGNGYQC